MSESFEAFVEENYQAAYYFGLSLCRHALQFVCFDASVVAHWVTEKSTALQMGKLLDKPLYSMQMIGSSTADWMASR